MTQQTMIEVTADDIRLAMEAGAAAAHRQLPPAAARALAAAGIADTPEHRAMGAVAALFEGEKFRALMARIGAMTEALQDDRAKPYLQASTIGLPGDEVDEAVAEVAATLPLNWAGQFDRSAFFSALAIAKASRGGVGHA